MRIILSYLRLIGFGGTETYIFTTVQELGRLGHDVSIYSPQTGAFAEFARSYGVRVDERLSDLPATCDAVLAQDGSTAHTLASRYPDAVRLFVAHSIGHPLQLPPQTQGTCEAVIVLNDNLAQRIGALAWHPEIVRLRQPIELKRFCFRDQGLEQRRPPRVLAMSNNLVGARARIIEQACAKAGLQLTRAGIPSSPTATPEQRIADAEIVISLGRGILEAMASGRAAYVFGEAGGDGWVTAENYHLMESAGFDGRALGRSIDAEVMAGELAEWDEQLGEVGRGLVAGDHAGDLHAMQLVELIRRLGGSALTPMAPAEELARLVRMEWSSFEASQVAIHEARRLREQNAQLRDQLGHAQADRLAHQQRSQQLEHLLQEREGQRQELEGTLQELTGSKRYRLAGTLMRPLDRLRMARAPKA